jgi:hypothetical protein
VLLLKAKGLDAKIDIIIVCLHSRLRRQIFQLDERGQDATVYISAKCLDILGRGLAKGG